MAWLAWYYVCLQCSLVPLAVAWPMGSTSGHMGLLRTEFGYPPTTSRPRLQFSDLGFFLRSSPLQPARRVPCPQSTAAHPNGNCSYRHGYQSSMLYGRSRSVITRIQRATPSRQSDIVGYGLGVYVRHTCHGTHDLGI